jgi:hypothetical protein
MTLFILGLDCQSLASNNTQTGQPQYPDDISGNVIVAGYLVDRGTIYRPPSNNTFWVVDIIFTNNMYELPDISGYDHWNIVFGNTYYWIPELLKTDKLQLLIVSTNQTEKKLVCCQEPDSTLVSDTRLDYETRKIISFGRLTGGAKVNGYNWDL